MSHPYTPGFGYIPQLGLPSWLVDPETDDDFARLYPGTYGNYTSTPEDPSGMGPATMPRPGATGPVRLPRAPRMPTPDDIAEALQGPRPPTMGWAARLFGGADPLASGLLDPTQARGLGRQALLQTGLSLLANSGPSPYRRGLGELLATGIQSGQQAYQQGAEQAIGQQGILQQMQGRAQLRAIHQRYQGRNDPESQRALLNDLITLGTPEALQAARSLSEYLKSQRETQQRPVAVRTVDERGNPVTRFVEPEAGQEFRAPAQDNGLPAYLTPKGIEAAVTRADALRGSAPLSPGESARLQGFNELIALSNDIIGGNGRPGLLAQNPQGVGLTRFMPDWINTRTDPDGIALRSTISNLKTTIRQLRSGAAVTPQEATQLEGMLPDRSDSPTAVAGKIRALLPHLQRLVEGVRTRGGTRGTGRDTDDYVPPPR